MKRSISIVYLFLSFALVSNAGTLSPLSNAPGSIICDRDFINGHFRPFFYYNVGQETKKKLDQDCSSDKPAVVVEMEATIACFNKCVTEVNPEKKNLSLTSVKTNEINKCQAECRNMSNEMEYFIAGYDRGQKDCTGGTAAAKPNTQSGK